MEATQHIGQAREATAPCGDSSAAQTGRRQHPMEVCTRAGATTIEHEVSTGQQRATALHKDQDPGGAQGSRCPQHVLQPSLQRCILSTGSSGPPRPPLPCAVPCAVPSGPAPEGGRPGAPQRPPSVCRARVEGGGGLTGVVGTADPRSPGRDPQADVDGTREGGGGFAPIYPQSTSHPPPTHRQSTPQSTSTITTNPPPLHKQSTPHSQPVNLPLDH